MLLHLLWVLTGWNFTIAGFFYHYEEVFEQSFSFNFSPILWGLNIIKSRLTENQVWFICGWPSKPHLFNFMHQWDDTSCFVQRDSLLHCITQHADATRHAKLTWSTNPGNSTPQTTSSAACIVNKCCYSSSCLLVLFRTNGQEWSILSKKFAGNSKLDEVELGLFLCRGLLKGMGISGFGLAWEGEWLTVFLAGAVPSFS